MIEGLSSHSQHQLDRIMQNYRLTPMTLAQRLNSAIMAPPFLNFISAKVASTIHKGNGRLVISVPPRHGKSEIITKNTPIWLLENYGKKNVILATYGAELSSDFGRKVRDLVGENEDSLNMRLRVDAQRVNNWLTDEGGAMMSVGLGGPITGRGADVLLIDDYIKEIKESLSQSHRDYIWNWFVTTAFTRIEPGGSCIIIATRWHDDDLIGRIIKNNPGGNWEHVVIPALAEPEGYKDGDIVPDSWTDMFGRKFGDALFPQRYSRKELLERKEILGTYFFNALFQQRPENDSNKLTNRDWLKYVDRPPEGRGVKFARIWDLAATEDGGDWTVGTLVAYEPAIDFATILHVERRQLSPGQVEELVVKTAARDGPNVEIGIEREPGSSGKALCHHYRETVLKGYKVTDIPANDAKLIRAQPFLAAVEAGKVALLKASWNLNWADEYDGFPAGDHDDQVDTAGAGYTLLSGKDIKRTSWGREPDAVKAADGIKPNKQQEAKKGSIILPNGKEFTYEQNNGIILLSSTVMKKKAGICWGR